MRTIERNPFEVVFRFTAQEIGWLRAVARRRQAPKSALPDLVVDKRIMERDNVETHLIGVMGEAAVARLLNIPFDESSYLAGDRVKDFVCYGVSIEVKTLRGYLAFPKLADFKADVAVLVLHEPRDLTQVWVQGWVSRKDFAKSCFTADFGYGPRPCMQPADLVPIVTLKAHCLMLRNLRRVVQAGGG